MPMPLDTESTDKMKMSYAVRGWRDGRMEGWREGKHEATQDEAKE